ncbi:MAG: aminotransferase class V-fold PLP-dependent enzyme, partial [Alphaproteobacteria bacterium]
MNDQVKDRDIRPSLGLRPIINVSGTMTALGASIIVPEAIAAMAAIAPQFVEIDALHRKASRIIARLTAAEAGFVTASCASGIALAVAGAMTRDNLLAIERLPDDTAGLKAEVLIQVGHIVNYGASVEQSIRLAGATVVPVGTVSSSYGYQLDNAINERTAAALYVVAHHTVQYGMIALKDFAAICRAKDVPVIVDAASEYDLKGFLAQGADVVIYSGHKFLGGPTTGIVAGRKDLVRAAYLQNRGIGRGMKVGKESIAGVMAALEAWEKRDHAGIRKRERQALDLWLNTLQAIPGIVAEIVPDPTDNPLDRLKVQVHPDSSFSAASLAAALAAGDPPVIV